MAQPWNPPPSADHRARRDRLRGLLTDTADVLVVSDLINVRYLTGFTGSNAAVLVGTDPAADRISTDGRYLTQVAEQSGDLEAVIARNCLGELVEHAGKDGAVRIGFEEHIVTVAAHRDLDGDLVGTSGLVERLREVKDAGEVDLLRRACAVADEALAAIIERGLLSPGRTEREVARALEWEMYERGADAVSFETIVAAGANSAIPHHRPTSAALAAGDFVKIDFGAAVAGYHSDMTRTYVLGHAADWQREIYDLVAAAQAAGRAALSPGADLRGVDAAARSVIADAGYGDKYVHGLGHGIGLQIHEAPGIGSAAAGTLPCGAAVTVEPGVYLPGRGGVRIEDSLVVTEGGPDLLTTTDKTFTVI
ncbi:M24 family metallopeptidase [Gordonia amarae]|uniref:M24 family metallopeptidase n=2 Tax=Gordonia amarae TaxID=36821 RepID=A0A857KXJ4_9ACTN|nr:aminopeptidase P family protein [Gordonia amarae]MCS3879235.1 Xaa-Pro aminopeptidase [Gordonia amarae]QHN17739.1 M24 family metallopeptidase [Gordonia amarae]QHN22269.1 M24 family metallopeptidase [Gordonia amarae]QHN31145.1 M24 family metallopeptidase [Gordonia amarae]QHN39891.1 M24 family metallopeptidase [Gordonia amarae]